jgi:hypothetical protein
MFKHLFFALLLLFLGGCINREIYTEIADKSYISHPPSSLQIDDLSGMLKSDFKNTQDSPLKLEVYLHKANCTNPQSRSLGADFDGYIRITIRDQNKMIARAQMDYKGQVQEEDLQEVYEHLMNTLQWKNGLKK